MRRLPTTTRWLCWMRKHAARPRGKDAVSPCPLGNAMEYASNSRGRYSENGSHYCFALTLRDNCGRLLPGSTHRSCNLRRKNLKNLQERRCWKSVNIFLKILPRSGIERATDDTRSAKKCESLLGAATN